MKVEKDKEIVEETIQDQEVENEADKVEEEPSSDEPNLEADLEEAKDKYIRLYSEFENFRRRTSKEKLELIGTANRELMSELLPVLDDFDRALTASNDAEDAKSLLEGVELIQQKLKKSLESKGLKRMEVKKGDKFDDEKHEAITQIPAEKKLEGKVVDVIEPGYYLKETVIRFAKVVVGAKK